MCYLIFGEGAWEIQTDPSMNGIKNQVMRQVVPVWPACWGYSCSGPTTFFGMTHKEKNMQKYVIFVKN